MKPQPQQALVPNAAKAEQLCVQNDTGWDIGKGSTPILTYIDQLEDKSIKILIPGCGNAHEAEYLVSKDFLMVF